MFLDGLINRYMAWEELITINFFKQVLLIHLKWKYIKFPSPKGDIVYKDAFLFKFSCHKNDNI